MARKNYIPHIDLMLRAMRIGPDRLFGPGKIAVDARLLRAVIQLALERAPFDAGFYRSTYPDIDAAFTAGRIPDLHHHFVEQGYFEGRCGAPPALDEAFYVMNYRDVAKALTQGEIASPSEHYIRAGAAEGRNPSPALIAEVAFWADLLQTRAA